MWEAVGGASNRWLRQNGISTVSFACGYRHKKIRKYFRDGRNFGVAIRYLVEREPLGTGGAIKQALRSARSNPVVVVNGDILTNLDLNGVIRWHESRSFLATILGVPLKCPYGVLEEDGDRVCGFREKPVFPNVWVNAGVYVMERDAVEYLQEKGDVERQGFPELADKGMLGLYRSDAW